MRQIGITVPLLIVILAVALPRSAAEEKGEANKQDRLVGTWKLVSAKWGGREAKFPEGTTYLKHITPTQFMWAMYGKDGKVTRAAGGGYTVKGEIYEETPEYGISRDFDLIRGKVQAFKWRVDSNKWYHSGKLHTGLTIEEVWERVEKK